MCVYVYDPESPDSPDNPNNTCIYIYIYMHRYDQAGIIRNCICGVKATIQLPSNNPNNPNNPMDQDDQKQDNDRTSQKSQNTQNGGKKSGAVGQKKSGNGKKGEKVPAPGLLSVAKVRGWMADKQNTLRDRERKKLLKEVPL